MTTRRERLRAATITEIKQAALEQIAAVGAPALSLRGVARAIGMSPAGLYRYYDGRDALLTALITDAYNALADAVEAGISSVGESPRERFGAGIRAYRRWSLDNPNQFLLIFGTPIPGYAAPEGGPTVAALQRMGDALFRVGIEAWVGGSLPLHQPSRVPVDGEVEMAKQIHPDLPPTLIGVMLGAWARFHGLVTLEVLGQLDWMYGDKVGSFFDAEVERLLDDLGL
jgi:AcrR family transcriptional regulator